MDGMKGHTYSTYTPVTFHMFTNFPAWDADVQHVQCNFDLEYLYSNIGQNVYDKGYSWEAKRS